MAITMNERHQRLFALTLAGLMLIGTAHAQHSEPAAAPAESGRAEAAQTEQACMGAMNSPEFVGCMDQLVKRYLFSDKGRDPEGDAVAGAVVAVVHRGQIAARGYGCADTETGRAVYPGGDGRPGTMFRAGSLSKLFVVTAAMRLVQDGVLDLDADIDDYLDFELPDSKYGAITMRHLLTHTAGFDETMVGSVTHAQTAKQNDNGLIEFRDFLRQHPARRSRPAAADLFDGRSAGYSNYGMALAGYIVEHVANRRLERPVPFQDYVAQSIFEPLGMADATFWEQGQPGWVSAWDDQLARGHAAVDANGTAQADEFAPRQSDGGHIGCKAVRAGSFDRREFEHLSSIAPAGSLSVSGYDMARFMRMLLNRGAIPSGSMLQPARVAEILRVDGNHPPYLKRQDYPADFGGAGLGFKQMHRNGLTVLTHGGAVQRSRAFMALIPETGTGVFVATNSKHSNGYMLRNFFLGFVRMFLRPDDHPQQTTLPIEPARYVGTYLQQRHSETTVEKFLIYKNPANFVRAVSYAPDTRLLAVSNMLGTSSNWAQIAEDVFRWADPGNPPRQYQELIAFDRRGDRTYMLGPDPHDPAYQLKRYETPEFHRWLFALCQLAFVGLLAWPFIRTDCTTGAARAVRRLTLLMAAANLLGFAFIDHAFASIETFYVGYPAGLYVGLGLLLAAAVLTVALAIALLMAWPQRWWSAGERLLYSLGVIMAAAFAWALDQWNLIGFHLV